MVPAESWIATFEQTIAALEKQNPQPGTSAVPRGRPQIQFDA
jgi:hypothetical protein